MQFNNAFGRDFVPSRETSFSVCVSGGKQFNINAYTTPNINVEHRSLDWDRAVKKWSYLKGMPTPSPSHCIIGLLIGMNATKLHIQAKNERHCPPAGVDGPCGVLTLLGWCVIRSVPFDFIQDVKDSSASGATTPSQCFSLARLYEAEVADDALHQLVHQSFQLESIGIKPDVVSPISARNQLATDLVSSSYRNIGGRCTVALPFAQEVTLPRNRHIAFKTMLTRTTLHRQGFH